VQNLAKSISELAVLFKDLSMLVVEQGSVLDRIDFNIAEAAKCTTQANVHIDKTLTIERSGRARGCIIFLGSAIMICLIILMLRWTR